MTREETLRTAQALTSQRRSSEWHLKVGAIICIAARLVKGKYPEHLTRWYVRNAEDSFPLSVAYLTSGYSETMSTAP